MAMSCICLSLIKLCYVMLVICHGHQLVELMTFYVNICILVVFTKIPIGNLVSIQINTLSHTLSLMTINEVKINHGFLQTDWMSWCYLQCSIVRSKN